MGCMATADLRRTDAGDLRLALEEAADFEVVKDSVAFRVIAEWLSSEAPNLIRGRFRPQRTSTSCTSSSSGRAASPRRLGLG